MAGEQLPEVASALARLPEGESLPPGTIPPTLPWNALDGNVGVLIAAWDYVAATNDLDWYRARRQQLARGSRFLESRMDSFDGVVRCQNSGLPGDLDDSLDRSCEWFDIVNAGHEDAYINAFVDRAWRGLAALESRLGSDEAQRYTALANRIQEAYLYLFQNYHSDPQRRWLAWWRDSRWLYP